MILLLPFSFYSESCVFSAAVIVILFSVFQIPSEIAILVQCFKLLKASGHYHLQLLKSESIFIYKYLLKG